MAPHFQIYHDESVAQQPSTIVQTAVGPIKTNGSKVVKNKPIRYKPDALPESCRYYFDERKHYPNDGGEYCFEELNLIRWYKEQQLVGLQRENEELRSKVEAYEYRVTQLVRQLEAQQQQQQHQNPLPQQQQQQHHQNNRLSIVPQSLQPTEGLELYGANSSDLPSAVHVWDTSLMTDVMKTNTTVMDKFTVPIDQSQYIRENVPTSTPASKRDDDNRRPMFHNNRRQSRPSMGGGSPTLKLSPITETSREFNSKSSSSSATGRTPATVKKAPIPQQPVGLDIQVSEELLESFLQQTECLEKIIDEFCQAHNRSSSNNKQ